jgi:SHAQKYF class myb-like DNA-binding protein
MSSPTPCRSNKETSSSSMSLPPSLFSTQYSSCEHQHNNKGPLTLTSPTPCCANSNLKVGNFDSETNEESSSSTTSLPVPGSTISPSPYHHCFEQNKKKVAATKHNGGNHVMLIASRLTLPEVSRQQTSRRTDTEDELITNTNSRGDEIRISSNFVLNKLRNNDAHHHVARVHRTKNCDTSSNSETEEQLIIIRPRTTHPSCSSRSTTSIMTHPDSYPPMKHATFSDDKIEKKTSTPFITTMGHATKENPKPTGQAVTTVSKQHITETTSPNNTAAALEPPTTIHASTMIAKSSTTESSTQNKTSTITSTTTVTTTAKAPTDAIMNGTAETGGKYPTNLSIPTSTIQQIIPSVAAAFHKQASKDYEKKQSPQVTIDTIKNSPKKELNEVITIKNTNNNNTMSIIKMDQDEEAVSSSCHSVPPGQKVKTEDSKTISGGSPPNNKKKVSSSTSSGASPTNNKRKRSSSTTSSTCTSSKSPGHQTSGRWTQEEHQAFLEGLKECGREWKKVSLRIPTRTSAQIRSHAQKYFSKLQRDHEILTAAAETASASPFMTAEDESGNFFVIGEGGYISGTIVTSNGGTAAATLAPSIRRKVERIVSNPRAAQREVENTLDALRERYRQLQQRLDDRQRLRQERRQQQSQQQQQPQRVSNVVGEASASAASYVSSSLQNNSNEQEQQQQQQQQQPRFSRKRMQLPINHHDVTNRSPSDENSSVSSNVSSIAASRSDLGDKEIIALEVLGDTLSRGDSANDLPVLAAEEEDNNNNNNNASSLLPRIDSSIEEGTGMVGATNDNLSSSSLESSSNKRQRQDY